VAVAAHQPDSAALPVRQDAKAVVLDFVNPAGARRRLLSRPRQARLKRARGSIGADPAPKLTQTSDIKLEDMRWRPRVESGGDHVSPASADGGDRQ
jgi:hypothetical protein